MISFIGPPGCGKGTQAQLFQSRFGLKVFSFGEFLRKEACRGSQAGIQIKEIGNKGEVVPPELLFSIIDMSVFSEDVILDGLPRTLSQAVFFDDFLKKNKLNISHVIEFCIDENILLERIKKRKVCLKCDRVVLADRCKCLSAEFAVRSDDNIEVFKNRMRVYKKHQSDICSFYNSNSFTHYYSMNASGDTETVFNKIKKRIFS